MMKAIASLALGLAMLTAAGAAEAQQPREQIEVAAGKPFKHKHTRLQLPPAIDGIARSGLVTLEPDQLDVIGRYDKPDGSEAISIYIYRELAGALPVWFDRARWAIENRTALYGTPRLSERPLAFVPPMRTEASGLIATYTSSHGALRSTGVALVPLDGWLVKIRYSSASMDADALDQRIRTVLAGLGWPRKLAPAPVATPVEPCAAPLAASERSRPAPPNPAGALVGALLGAPGIATSKTAPATAAWCRDDSVDPKGAVYRAGGATDAYLIALSDAGRGIRVAPDASAALLDQAAKPSWSIELLQMARTVRFASQDRLPPPQQAAEIVNGGRYVSAASTWGKQKTITISNDQLQ